MVLNLTPILKVALKVLKTLKGQKKRGGGGKSQSELNSNEKDRVILQKPKLMLFINRFQ